MFARWDPDEIARILAEGWRGLAWTLSNHDFPRVATRLGEENVRLAATLTLTLPGTAFVYQGDEIGLPDGPGHDPPYDRAGRDPFRHPMQWEPAPDGGFGPNAWLAPIDPLTRNVADQRNDPGSLLNLYRDLIALRRELGDGIAFRESAPGTLVYERGDDHVVAIDVAGTGTAPATDHAEIVLQTARGYVARSN
jgi:alpha-glucosidase